MKTALEKVAEKLGVTVEEAKKRLAEIAEIYIKPKEDISMKIGDDINYVEIVTDKSDSELVEIKVLECIDLDEFAFACITISKDDFNKLVAEVNAA